MKSIQKVIVLFIFLMTHTLVNAQLKQLTHDKYDEFHLRWSPDGSKISFTENRDGKLRLMYISVTGGEKVPVEINKTGDFYNSWSPDGTQLVFDAYDGSGPALIWKVSINGGAPEKLTEKGCFMPNWSPDGNTIAFFRNSDIYTMPASGGVMRRITTNASFDYHPVWSPDGSKILFTSDRSGNNDLWTIPAAGGTATQITTTSSDDDRPCWSPSGDKIAFLSTQNGIRDLWIKSLTTNELIQITNDEYWESWPAWSPDGKQLAFGTNFNGQNDIAILDLPANITAIHKKEESNSPEDFQLLANYPNPFNPSTTIHFSLSKPQFIKLTILDITGKHVKTLLNETRHAGQHSIIWNGQNEQLEKVASGIYFNLLETERSSKTNRMILLR